MGALMILFVLLGTWLLIASLLDWDASCGVIDLQTPGILLGENVIRRIVAGFGVVILFFAFSGC